MEKGLHGKVKRDTHGKGKYTERKLHKSKGIYKEKKGTTRNGERGLIN